MWSIHQKFSQDLLRSFETILGSHSGVQNLSPDMGFLGLLVREQNFCDEILGALDLQRLDIISFSFVPRRCR